MSGRAEVLVLGSDGAPPTTLWVAHDGLLLPVCVLRALARGRHWTVPDALAGLVAAEIVLVRGLGGDSARALTEDEPPFRLGAGRLRETDYASLWVDVPRQVVVVASWLGPGRGYGYGDPWTFAEYVALGEGGVARAVVPRLVAPQVRSNPGRPVAAFLRGAARRPYAGSPNGG